MKIIKSILTTSLLVGSIQAASITINNKTMNNEEIIQITQSMFNTDFSKKDARTQREIIDKIVEYKILLSEARANKIDQSKEYLTAIKNVQNMILIDSYSKTLFDDFKVTDELLKEYFFENKSNIVGKAQVNANHILVKSEAAANDIIASLGKSSNVAKTFKELAIKLSTGPSGKNGGSLGWFGKGQMVPAFETIAFSLGKGTFSKSPVKTQFGYHIIYVVDKREGNGIDLKKFLKLLSENPNKMKKVKFEMFKLKLLKKISDLKESKYDIKIN